MLNPNPKAQRSLVVVVSAGQSRNPAKRELEKEIATKASNLLGVRVVTIPHLYDLAPKGESFEALRGIEENLVVLSWLFDRAAHWVLDRNGIRGQVGEVELREEIDEEESGDDEQAEASEERVTDSQPRPGRRIYCLDFRVSNDASDFVAEIDRIADECADEGFSTPAAVSDSSPLTIEMLQRHSSPTNDTYVGATHEPNSEASAESPSLFGVDGLVTIDEHPGRRWYPVIDFSRCTNCMECIDFCLFGVYGVDVLETIVVEQADNCRKGCPACSRVCPQNAIIFPQHKTPAIAGAPVDTGGLKIDLSKLFGAPEQDEDAVDVAARERDEQLILAGREAVGKEVGLKQRVEEGKASKGAQADDLDELLDELDSLDL
ncbi:MAG: ATP-binding protein [Aureliella sp.]